MEITFIAIEGFFINFHDKKILIDALLGSNIEPYGILTNEVRQKMINANHPFNDVSLVDVSHSHFDHFDPSAVILHLENNNNALLVAPEEVTQQLKLNPNYNNLDSQIKPIGMGDEKTYSLEKMGIKLQIIMTRHGVYLEEDPESGQFVDRHKNTQNLSFLLDIDSNIVFHPGDAGIEYNQDKFEKLFSTGDSVDLAFLHTDFLLNEEGRNVTDTLIRPKIIIPMHLDPISFSETISEIKKYYSTILVPLENLMDTVTI